MALFAGLIGLLRGAQFIGQGGDGRVELSDALTRCDSLGFRIR